MSDRPPRLAWLVLCGLIFCAPGVARADDVVIAEIANHDPQQAVQWRAYLAGVQASLEQANQAAGVQGRRFVLRRAARTVGDADVGAEVQRVIAAHRPVALVGYVSDSGLRQLALSGFDRLRVPLMGVPTADEDAPGALVFRTRAGLAEELTKICHQLAATRFTSVAALVDDGEQGQQAWRKLNELPACRRLTLTARGAYPVGTASVSREVSAFIEAAPQAIVIVGTVGATAAFIEQYRREGGKAALLATSQSDPERLGVRLSDGELRGMAQTQVAPNPARIGKPVVRDFLLARARLEEPPPMTFTMMEGYVAGRMLLAAIRRVRGPLTAEAVWNALEAMEPQDLGGFVGSAKRGKDKSLRNVDLTVLDAQGRVRQ